MATVYYACAHCRTKFPFRKNKVDWETMSEAGWVIRWGAFYCGGCEAISMRRRAQADSPATNSTTVSTTTP